MAVLFPGVHVNWMEVSYRTMGRPRENINTPQPFCSIDLKKIYTEKAHLCVFMLFPLLKCLHFVQHEPTLNGRYENNPQRKCV